MQFIIIVLIIILLCIKESPGSDAEMSVEETTDERATLLDAGTSSLQSLRFNKRKFFYSEIITKQIMNLCT
jgi:hypothetical protein